MLPAFPLNLQTETELWPLCVRRLEPGMAWKGEVALRWHDKFWEIPLFDRGPQPNGLADPMPGYEKLERERKMPVMPPRQGQDSKRMPAFDQSLSV